MFINAGFAIKVEWKNVFKFVVQIFYNMGGIKSIVRQNIWVSANVTDFKMWNIVQIGTLRLSKYEKFKYLEKSKSKNMYLKFIITMLWSFLTSMPGNILVVAVLIPNQIWFCTRM